MQEIWKDIPNYEGLYQISNLGNVKSLERIVTHNKYGTAHIKEKLLRPRDDSKGYGRVVLYKNNKKKQFKIHRLVAETFLPNKSNKSAVNHIDGNKKNNNVNNLEWCTIKENNIHAFENGLNSIKMRAVYQMDLEGNVINEFKSLCDASKFLNKQSHHNIMYCCNGKTHTAYGYKWKYKDS